MSWHQHQAAPVAVMLLPAAPLRWIPCRPAGHRPQTASICVDWEKARLEVSSAQQKAAAWRRRTLTQRPSPVCLASDIPMLLLMPAARRSVLERTVLTRRWNGPAATVCQTKLRMNSYEDRALYKGLIRSESYQGTG